MAGFAEIAVEDNGIGIAKQYHEKAFRIFERVHTEGDYPGNGIGLAIVQKAVERMGGTVHLESQPGKGSRFAVRLPWQRSGEVMANSETHETHGSAIEG
jgi:signal transduction histidine kinase